MIKQEQGHGRAKQSRKESGSPGWSWTAATVLFSFRRATPKPAPCPYSDLPASLPQIQICLRPSHALSPSSSKPTLCCMSRQEHTGERAPGKSALLTDGDPLQCPGNGKGKPSAFLVEGCALGAGRGAAPTAHHPRL